MTHKFTHRAPTAAERKQRSRRGERTTDLHVHFCNGQEIGISIREGSGPRGVRALGPRMGLRDRDYGYIGSAGAAARFEGRAYVGHAKSHAEADKLIGQRYALRAISALLR
jgi:hypothetical protein